MKGALIRFFKGIAVGVSGLVPGLSGSVVMVALNFYDGMIEAYNTLLSNFKKSILFLLPFEIGGTFVAPILFSSLLVPIQGNFPFQTNLFFAAAIAGSIPFIWSFARKEKFRWTHAIPFTIALAFVVAMAILQKPIAMEEIAALQNATQETVVSGITAPDGIGGYLFLLFCGCLGSACGVIPGFSSSFLMILLGAYPIVMGAWAGLTNPDTMGAAVLTLLPFLGGNLLGILGISKVISFLLKKYYSYCYSAILGLVTGSIFSILYSPKTYHTAAGEPITWSVWGVVIAVVVFAAGFSLAFFLGKIRPQKQEGSVADSK